MLFPETVAPQLQLARACAQAMQHSALTRRLAIYAGHCLILRSVPAAQALCSWFASTQHHVNGSSTATAEAQCRRFEQDATVVACMKQLILQDSGLVDRDRRSAVCWDRVRLRVQPPTATQESDGGMDDVCDPAYGHGRFSSTLPVHRDTWGSNQPHQLNWWLPLTPLAPNRTLLLYKSFFERPVPNTSGEWDFEELKAARRRGERYPQLPTLASHKLPPEELEAAAEPVLIDPGDVLVFSGAHLHASASNTTDETRFSCEVRTVDAGDVAAGVSGAPNVDGHAPRVPTGWFRSITDSNKSFEHMVQEG